VTPDLSLNVQFEDGKTVLNRQGVRRLPVEQVSIEVEGIGQAVRRVDAHHHRAIVQFCQLHTGGSRQAGFAHPAFSAE
jgi:hypothetical protein